MYRNEPSSKSLPDSKASGELGFTAVFQSAYLEVLPNVQFRFTLLISTSLYTRRLYLLLTELGTVSLNVPAVGRPVIKLDCKISPKNKGKDHTGFLEVLSPRSKSQWSKPKSLLSSERTMVQKGQSRDDLPHSHL